MARYSRTQSALDTLLTLGIVGGAGYLLYEFLSMPSSNTPPSSPGSLLYNAVTGLPAETQIAPPPVYTGPNAPAGNASMLAFLNAGGDANSEIPGTGQTATDLLNSGYSWDEINSMWQSTPRATSSPEATGIAQGIEAGIGVTRGLLGIAEPNAYTTWLKARAGA
jgi:hypothetical protein